MLHNIMLNPLDHRKGLSTSLGGSYGGFQTLVCFISEFDFLKEIHEKPSAI